MRLPPLLRLTRLPLRSLAQLPAELLRGNCGQAGGSVLCMLRLPLHSLARLRAELLWHGGVTARWVYK